MKLVFFSLSFIHNQGFPKATIVFLPPFILHLLGIKIQSLTQIQNLNCKAHDLKIYLQVDNLLNTHISKILGFVMGIACLYLIIIKKRKDSVILSI